MEIAIIMTDRIDNFPKRAAPQTRKGSARHMDIQRFVLALLLSMAKAGKRCPTTDQIRDICGKEGFPVPIDCTVSELAHRGFLISEVYALNYRVIEIDGHRTAPAPGGGPPYKIIGGPAS